MTSNYKDNMIYGRLKDNTIRYYLRIGFLTILLFTVLIGLAACNNKGDVNFNDTELGEGANVLEDIDTGDTGNTNESTDISIYVQICGSVAKPGVYKVQKGARIFEVVDLAGGILENSSTDTVNMAQIVEDQMKIYIPTIEEVTVEEIELNQDCCVGDGLININTASADELMTLPGIGQSKANSIITYRQDVGQFSDKAQIMNISGIKEAAYGKIKDKIKV